MDFDCETEINRLFTGSMYIFGFFTFFLITISSGYNKMERYLTYRILDLEKKLEAYKRGVDTLSSDESDEATSTDEDTSTDEEVNPHEVIVNDRWEYKNTI